MPAKKKAKAKARGRPRKLDPLAKIPEEIQACVLSDISSDKRLRLGGGYPRRGRPEPSARLRDQGHGPAVAEPRRHRRLEPAAIWRVAHIAAFDSVNMRMASQCEVWRARAQEAKEGRLALFFDPFEAVSGLVDSRPDQIVEFSLERGVETV